MMKLIIDNRLKLYNIPSALKEWFANQLTFTNPLYEEAIRHNRYVGRIDPYICLYDSLRNGISLPRGYLQLIETTMIGKGLDLSIHDNRILLPPISVKSNIKLRNYQIEAKANLLSHPNGMLIAPAASGKTIIGLDIFATLRQPMIWLTHTTRLANQVIERIVGSNDNPPVFEDITEDEIGFIGGGRFSIGDRITIGMIPTLVRRPTELPILGKKFGLVIVDECLVEGSQILMMDGSLKDIKDIKNGDVTTFGVVSHKFCRTTDKLVQLQGEFGYLEGTPTHRLPYIPYKVIKDDFKEFSENDVIVDELNYINEKDFLLIAEKFCHTSKYKIGKEKSRLLAFEIMEYLNKCIPAGEKSQIIEIPNIMLNATIDDIINFLQVVFDIKGSVTDQITLTMASCKFVYGVSYLLRKLGIISSILPIKHKNMFRLSISGYDAFLFWKKIGFSIERKQQDLVSLMQKTIKFRKTVHYKGVTYRCMQVISKKVINKITNVYDFTTEKHLFIANGILSSNCHHVPASTFLKVLGHFSSYYFYGLTATPYRRDKMEDIMFATIGLANSIIQRKEVVEKGGIITPVVLRRSIPSPKYDGNNYHYILRELVLPNEKRKLMIVTDVLREAYKGNYCIVISTRKSYCEDLYKIISEHWPKSAITTGSYTRKHNDEQIDKLEKGEVTVLITTFELLGEGFDVRKLNRGFIALPFRERARVEQAVGRIQRTCENKIDAILYDYVDENIGILRNQFMHRAAVYKSLGIKIIE